MCQGGVTLSLAHRDSLWGPFFGCPRHQKTTPSNLDGQHCSVLRQGLTFRYHDRLHSSAEHNHKALPSLQPVVAVIKSILPPHPPLTSLVSAQREASYMHRLIQPLEISVSAGTTHCLCRQLAHSRSRQKVNTQSAKHKQDN